MNTSAEERPESAPAEHESLWGVLGIGLGLLLIAGVVWRIMSQRAGSEDPERLLEEWFVVDELPFDLEPARAALLPGGERIVVLDGPQASELDREDPEPASEPESESEGRDSAETEEHDSEETAAEDTDSEEAGGETDTAEETSETSAEEDTDQAPRKKQEKKIDWAQIETLEEGTPPVRVMLVNYPEQTAESVFLRQFRSLNWTDLNDIGNQGGRTTLDSDRMRWGQYETQYVHERLYKKNESFRDLLRVNLGLPGRYCVAYAFWAPSHPASPERMQELLTHIAPRLEPQPEDG